MKLQEVTAYNLRSQNILNESWNTLTESQRLYIGKWEKELWPLLEEYVRVCEADLTANQIQAIFTSAEQQAAGQKTGLGKAASAAGAALKMPVELAKKVDAKINELGRMAQNAGPIKNADQKFEKLKKQITANNSDSKIVQGIQKISDWAKENPGKASLAVGILTTIAAFAGGPAGGAAAGLILRASKDLLQGEKLSTATGKSVKTAAYGAAAGKAFDVARDAMGSGADAASAAAQTKADAAADAAAQTKAGAAADAAAQTKLTGADAIAKMKADAGSGFSGNIDITDKSPKEIMKAIKDGGGDSGFAARLRSLISKDSLSTDQAQQLVNSGADFSPMPANIAKMLKSGMEEADIVEILSAAGKSSSDINIGLDMARSTFMDSVNYAEILALYNSLSMEQKYRLYIQEGPLTDKLKGAASKVAGAAKGAAGKAAAAVKQAGKDITQQVTANKLMKAWKAAGEPTDTGSIVNILASAGVSDDQIATIGQEQKVKLPAPTKAPQAGDAETPQAGDAEKPQIKSGGAKALDGASTVDLKGLVAQIKKLPPEAVVEIKAALQKDLSKTAV